MDLQRVPLSRFPFPHWIDVSPDFLVIFFLDGAGGWVCIHREVDQCVHLHQSNGTGRRHPAPSEFGYGIRPHTATHVWPNGGVSRVRPRRRRVLSDACQP
jgi:hypothetical protein